MKKLFLIAILGVLSLASCKKDRTCTCTVTSTATPAVPVATTVTDYPKSKKSAAKAACAVSTNVMGRRQVWSTVEHFDAVGPIAAYTKTTTCELK